MYRLLTKIDNFIERATIALLIIVLALMLTFSIVAITLRWLQVPLLGIEPFVRHLVFLCAFLGGIVATGRKNHIAIDIIGKYLESRDYKRFKSWVSSTTYLVSTVTLIWLTIASYGFFAVELMYGRDVFWGVHSGALVAIIPIGFSIIAFRFFYLFVDSFIPKKEES